MMNTRIASLSNKISLAGLSALLVKRWKLMLAIFLFTLLTGIAFALLRPLMYTYTSLYAIAETANEEGELTGLEAPSVLLAQLNDQILPNQERHLDSSLGEQGGDASPLTVKAQHLEGTHLISLSTQARERQAEHIEAVHRQALETLAEQQAIFAERRRGSLERRLAIIQKSVKFAGADTDVHPQLLDEIEHELVALKAGEIKQVAVRSEQSLGMQAPLIVAIAATLGLLLALIGAFACHFTGRLSRLHSE